MKNKIIGIFVCMLLIATAVPVMGTMNESVIGMSIEVNNKMNFITPFITTIPNDPFFELQWALDNTGQTGGTPDADIDAPEAWDIETGNEDVLIAIIDSGIDYTHPDLEDKIWNNEDEIPDNGFDDDNNGYIDDLMGYDFINNDTDPLDDHGHGTLIAGIIGASTNNSYGMSGIVWDCEIMPIKVWNTDGSGLTVDIVLEALVYATDNGADVISMSLGGYDEHFTQEEFVQMLATVNYSYNQGCIIVAGAGNEDTSNPMYPAALPNVLGVAGTDHKDRRMEAPGLNCWSNYGDWVDVAAPGEYIFTTSPTYDCWYTQHGYPYNWCNCTGTSFATPHVSGLVALLISKNPTYSQDKIMSIVKDNVDPYDSTYDLGTGRINAYKALTEFNVAPNTPETPSGKKKGKPGKEYSFTTSTTDPDGDIVAYMWDWGDGNRSEWLDNNEASYTWEQKGNYIIKVRSRDIYGARSKWSDPFEVTIPKNKAFIFNFPILNWLFERFPNAFPMLRYILGL